VKASKLIVIALTFLIMLSGCTDTLENTNLRMGVSKVGSPYTYEKVCIDNVVYMEAARRSSVWINPNTLAPSNCKIVNGKMIIGQK